MNKSISANSTAVAIFLCLVNSIEADKVPQQAVSLHSVCTRGPQKPINPVRSVGVLY